VTNLPMSIIQISSVAESFMLYQNYPNPFNPSTVIKFSLVRNGNVKLSVFDITGKEVKILIDEVKNAGVYEVTFDAENLSGGIYFYKIVAGSHSEIKKMMLVK
jgi:hypothetical protein